MFDISDKTPDRESTSHLQRDSLPYITTHGAFVSSDFLLHRYFKPGWGPHHQPPILQNGHSQVSVSYCLPTGALQSMWATWPAIVGNRTDEHIFPVQSLLWGQTLWWRHQMETFSALLALCAGNSPVTGEFPSQRPVTRSFDVFFDLCLE